MSKKSKPPEAQPYDSPHDDPPAEQIGLTAGIIASPAIVAAIDQVAAEIQVLPSAFPIQQLADAIAAQTVAIQEHTNATNGQTAALQSATAAIMALVELFSGSSGKASRITLTVEPEP